jgi:hypothetical protein
MSVVAAANPSLHAQIVEALDSGIERLARKQTNDPTTPRTR